MKSGAEVVNPYDDDREKTEQVEEMFDSIAPAYDFMNTAMSFGLHRSWRSKALDAVTKSLNIETTLDILDIATGTGDVAFDLQHRFPEARITGVDLSEKMLDIAKFRLKKSDKTVQNKLTFEKGNSLDLRFDNESFDLVTVAYGVRNFEYLDRGLKEMARVLKSGGKLCIIELSEPSSRPAYLGYKIYSRSLIPFIGKLISGDSRAYSYLPESIAAAPQRERMTMLLSECGFCDCAWKSLTMGVVTYYIASKK